MDIDIDIDIDIDVCVLVYIQLFRCLYITYTHTPTCVWVQWCTYVGAAISVFVLPLLRADFLFPLLL
jgi:hypothetical protein